MALVSPEREESAVLRPARASEFTHALARLASGVAVVACWDGDTPRGLLVTSLTGLSVHPPRLIFTVRREASAFQALSRVEHCSISILAEEDRDEAAAFGASEGAARRFSRTKWDLDDPLFPRFRDGLVAFDAQIEQRIDAGTHVIVIAAARAFDSREGAPLVYFDRQLHSLG